MSIISKFLDILFPDNFTCDICGREVFTGENLCADCKETVEVNDGDTCPVCGRKASMPGLCMECKASAPSFDRAFSALVYSSGTRKLVIKFKNGETYLRKYFARLITEKCREITDADAVCFVPMIKKAERSRGYNQSKLLAEEVGKAMNLPLLADALEKIKETKSQKKLGQKERLENLKGSFKANRQAVEGKSLIIIDDVLTTGATAEAVCSELKKRGAKKVYFATVASVEFEHDG